MRYLFVGIFALVVLTVFVTACSEDPPQVPIAADGQRDPVLVEGRSIYAKHCASCHGRSGGGGTGPRLNDGDSLRSYPDIGDQVAVINDGKGTMPSFGRRLSQEQIVSVARYIREVLN